MGDEALIYRGSEITDPEIVDSVPDDYRDLLQKMNGCVLFSGGLHIRGAVQTPEWHSLRKVWQGDFALSRLFPAVEESDVPFAQDCFGDQFLLRERVVHKLNAESGGVESLGMALGKFVHCAKQNPVEFLSLQPLLRFLNEGGELKLGQLLNAYPPFMMKQASDGVSLKAVSMFEQISFLADFAGQIGDVPEGTEVRIKVINVPQDES